MSPTPSLMTGCTIGVGTLVGVGVVLAVGVAATVESDGVIVGFKGVAVTATCVSVGTEVREGSITGMSVGAEPITWQAARSSVASTMYRRFFAIIPPVQ